MSRTIKRGPPPRRAVPKRKPPKQSLGDRILAHLPVSQEALRRAATWSILGVVGAGLIGGAIWLGVPQIAGTEMAEAAGRAGFRVEQIEITGLKQMDRMSVYAIALDQQSQAMPLVDLAGVRRKLLRYGWVADAHVSRRLPDTLLVHIVEREPVAIWQHNGGLTLIDRDGVVLAPVDRDRMPRLPLVIGPGADKQEPGYQQLMAAAPALKPRVKAAAWVANRRWDLTFDTGETLALPQDNARAALVRFAEMNGARRLLGKGWLRFDMRLPDRMFARKPGHDGDEAFDDRGASTKPVRIETAQAEQG